jgi:hypothetical protein
VGKVLELEHCHETEAAGKEFQTITLPAVDKNKARLIQVYLRLFEYIAHHGTYSDGFAGPQGEIHAEMWAAKLVLEMEPKWFREFWLCDRDLSKCTA